MKIFRVIAIFIVPLLPLAINAQTLNEEFKLLAEYTILKEQVLSIENENDWIAYPSDRIIVCNNILKEIQQARLNYEVREISKIDRYRFITIQDKTVRGPFVNSLHIFAITYTIPGLLEYIPIGNDIAKFISQFIFKDSPSLDKSNLIELYNVLESTLTGAIFFNGTNEKEFLLLSADYKLKQYNRLQSDRSSYWLENVCKVKQPGLAVYYLIRYNFNCSSFSVEKTLVYQLRE